MKITVENIEKEYPKISIPLPEPLSKDKFEKLTTTFLPNYDKSDVIKKMVDTFVVKLNEVVSKAEPKPKTAAKAAHKAEPKTKETIKSKSKSESLKPQNLTQLKKYLKPGMKLFWFYKTPNGWIKVNEGRPVAKVQGNAMTFETDKGESWLHFPKAAAFGFAKDYFSVDLESGYVMYYYYDDQSNNVDKITGQKTPEAFVKKAKTTTNAKKKIVPEISHWREDERLIRRFKAAVGKERTRQSILNVYRDIERRVTENKVGVISNNQQLIRKLQKKLKYVLDFMEKGGLTHIKIELEDQKFMDEINEVANGYKIRASVNLLKRFIGIEGEANPDKKKVQRLYDAFDKAVKAKKVTAQDVYADEFHEALETMKSYLDGDTNSIKVSPTTLRGLAGLGKPKATTNQNRSCAKSSGRSKRKKSKQLNGIDQEPVINKPVPVTLPAPEPVIVNRFQVDISKPTTSVDVRPMKNPGKETLSGLFSPITYNPPESAHDKIDLPGDLGRFLGYVERYEYSILLRGEKGAGKTRMLYQMMNTFAKAGFKVGSFSLEIGKQSNLIRDMRNEYISPTIANNVFIADEVPNGLQDIKDAAKEFDVVCIDSWGKIPGTKSDDFDKLRKEFPKTMFIVIFQSTTNGTARGGSMPEYDAGIVIQVADGGRAICEKNRYNGENLTFMVFQRKINESEPVPTV